MIFLRFLPTYLTNEEKGRLNNALEQFKEERGKVWNRKNSSHFYAHRKYDYFQQGDLLRQIRYPSWNKQDKTFDKVYINALVLSNTCDLDISNDRNITKEVVLAPITEYSLFIKKLALHLGKETLHLSLEESI